MSISSDDDLVTMRARDLVHFAVKWWQVARIGDVLPELMEQDYGGEPMQDPQAMEKLVQAVADDLSSLEVRDDGSLIFDDEPFTINLAKGQTNEHL